MTAKARWQVRPALVWAHRILGLATALFLVIAGLTGSVLAFHEELDQLLNPSAYRAKAHGAPLSPEALAARVDAGDPHRAVWYMRLEKEPGRSILALAAGKIDPATGKPYTLAADWLDVDPVSGEILAARKWGECCFSRLKLIPFLYEFHHTLSLPGTYGVLLMGVVALGWLVDGFVGFALTLPRGRPFLAKWRPAFGIKGGSPFRLSLDWHRAVGLWLFGVLIVVAISSVTMNLRQEVVEPVVKLVSSLTPGPFSGAPLATPRPRTLSYDVIMDRAVAEAQARNWRMDASEIFYGASMGVFGVAFGSRDDALGARWLYFDGETGAPVGEVIPGTGTAGDIFLQLQFPIHSGKIAGLPGRIAIAVIGLVVAGLSITGVMVWWMKRAGRVSRARKMARMARATAPAE
ncbi:PepSY-associated TM helix domain-containing protein [Azorhizobium sp. AG788]|uniref:PepSY-associated TM helix domain-containing protein n=1 Tax=Azorhizobium sp. AG788 TaxID=2183897 RepID=UPI00313A0E59